MLLLHALLPPPPAAPDDIAVHQTLVQGPPPRGEHSIAHGIKHRNGSARMLRQLVDELVPAAAHGFLIQHEQAKRQREYILTMQSKHCTYAPPCPTTSVFGYFCDLMLRRGPCMLLGV